MLVLVILAGALHVAASGCSNGMAVLGGREGDWLGYQLSGGGDFNGDGEGDELLGAYRANGYQGEAYVVFGRGEDEAVSVPAELNASWLDGANGFAVPGLEEQGYLGKSVAFVGDLNGDGLVDLAIGEPGRNILTGRELHCPSSR